MPNAKVKSWALFYFSFEGRATRYDFNIRFALVALLGSIVAYALDCMRFGGVIMNKQGSLLFSDVFNILVTVSFFAVTCRRLHDMNVSGWWQVPVHFIPASVIGLIVAFTSMAFLFNPLSAGILGFLAMLGTLIFYLVFFIFLSAKRGTNGPNRFGPDPLQTIETV